MKRITCVIGPTFLIISKFCFAASLVTFQNDTLVNRASVPIIVELEAHGRTKNFVLPAGGTTSIDQEFSSFKILKLIPIAPGIKSKTDSDCGEYSPEFLSVLDVPAANTLLETNKVLSEAASGFDANVSALNKLTNERKNQELDNPEVNLEINNARAQARYDYFSDNISSESYQKQSSNIEGYIMEQKRKVLINALQDRANNSSDATSKKEELFASQAKVLAKAEEQLQQSLQQISTTIENIKRKYDVKHHFDSLVYDQFDKNKLVYYPKVMDVTFECSSKEERFFIIASVNINDFVGEKYIRATVSNGIFSKSSVLLFPLNGNLSKYAAEIMWPFDKKNLVITVGGLEKNIARNRSLDDIYSELSDKYQKIKRERDKALYNSEGGIRKDSAVLGF